MKEAFFALSDAQKLQVLYQLVMINQQALPGWIAQFNEEFKLEMADREIKTDGQSSVKKGFDFLRTCQEKQFSADHLNSKAGQLENLTEHLSELTMWIEDADEASPHGQEREYAGLKALAELLDLLAEYDRENPLDDSIEEQLYRIIYLATIGSGNKEIPNEAVPGVKGEGGYYYYFNGWAAFEHHYAENEKLHKTYIAPLLTKKIKEIKAAN